MSKTGISIVNLNSARLALRKCLDMCFEQLDPGVC